MRKYDEKIVDSLWGCVCGAVYECGVDETLLQGTDGRVEGHREGDGGGYCDV